MKEKDCGTYFEKSLELSVGANFTYQWACRGQGKQDSNGKNKFDQATWHQCHGGGGVERNYFRSTARCECSVVRDEKVIGGFENKEK